MSAAVLLEVSMEMSKVPCVEVSQVSAGGKGGDVRYVWLGRRRRTWRPSQECAVQVSMDQCRVEACIPGSQQQELGSRFPMR